MSAAVQEIAELEALLDGKAPEPGRAICGYCYPRELFGQIEVVALCGHVYPVGSPWRPKGTHKCARCLALSVAPVLSCGHP